MLSRHTFTQASPLVNRFITACAIFLVSSLPVAAPAAAAAGPAAALPSGAGSEPPYLVLTLDDGLAEGLAAKPGQDINYSFKATNPTTTGVTGVRLVAIVPAHTHLAQPDGTGWGCVADPALGATRCERYVAAIDAGYSLFTWLSVVVDAPLPAETTSITLMASVSATEIVCGECGLAELVTPVDPSSNLLPAVQVFMPVVQREALKR